MLAKAPRVKELFPFKQNLYLIPFLHCGSPMAGCKRERNFNLEDMNSHASSSSCSSTQPTYEIHLFPDGTKASFTNMKTQLHKFCMHVFSVCKTNTFSFQDAVLGNGTRKKGIAYILTLHVWLNGAFFLTFATQSLKLSKKGKKITCHFKKPFIITLQP